LLTLINQKNPEVADLSCTNFTSKKEQVQLENIDGPWGEGIISWWCGWCQNQEVFHRVIILFGDYQREGFFPDAFFLILCCIPRELKFPSDKPQARSHKKQDKEARHVFKKWYTLKRGRPPKPKELRGKLTSFSKQRTERGRAINLFKKRIFSWITQLVVRQGGVIGMMARRLLSITMILIAQAAPLRWLGECASGVNSVFETVRDMTDESVLTLTAFFNETEFDEDDALLIPVPDKAADVPRHALIIAAMHFVISKQHATSLTASTRRRESERCCLPLHATTTILPSHITPSAVTLTRHALCW
jgi:hypothetical protein